MRNVLFCLLVGILFLGCSDENPSSSFAEVLSSSAIETFSSSIENVESSSSVVESSSSEIIISSSSGISYGELIDERDGQVYKTVKIGNQTWMAENLNYAYTKPIKNPYAFKEDSASWCYNNEPDNCTKYGRLYIWDAAMGDDAKSKKQSGYHFEQYYDYAPKGICPDNWHLASVTEWEILTGIATEVDLKSTSGWLEDGNGVDTFGFNIFPAGIYHEGEPWFPIGAATCFWTPTQWTIGLTFEKYTNYEFEGAFSFCFSSNNQYLQFFSDEMYKGDGLSVRCVKDSEVAK